MEFGFATKKPADEILNVKAGPDVFHFVEPNAADGRCVPRRPCDRWDVYIYFILFLVSR